MAITGRFVADFESFYAAVQKADVSLRGLDTGAGKVSTSLNKMVNSLSGSKLIQDATLMAEAVTRVGGAATLTAAEQLKVNRAVTEAIEKYKAMGQEAPQALTDMAAATRKVEVPTSLLSKTFGDLGTQIKATALGFISAQAIIGAVTTGFRLLTDFIGSSVASFAAAEAASRKLEAALKAQGNATPGLGQQYDALADKFQKTTVFADDLITEMQALLVQVGDVGPQQMEKALTAATDLASGLGIDLRTATLLVGKAFEGETGALKRYGIVVDEAKLKTQGITAVLDAVQEKFGGQAQAEIDTYAGKVKQLANAWDDVKESVGGFIVKQPALEVAIAQTLDLLRGSTSATGEFTEATGELTEATDRQAKAWFGADLGVFGFANGLRDGLRIVNDMAIGVDALRLELEMLSKVKPPASFGVGAPILLEGIDDVFGGQLMLRLRQEAENLVQQGLKPLNKEQKELISLFDKGGKSAGFIADKLKTSEAAVKQYLDAVKDAKKLIEETERSEKELAKVLREDVVKSYTDLIKSIQDYNRANIDAQQTVDRTGLKVSDFGKEIKLNTEAFLAWLGAVNKGIPVMADLGLKVNDFGKQIDLVTKVPVRSFLEDLRDGFDGFANAVGRLGQVVGGVFGAILQGAGGVLKSFGDLADATDTYRTALYNAQQAGKSTFALTAQYALQATASVVGYAQIAIGIINSLYDSLTGKEAQAALNARGGLHQLRTDAALAGAAFKDLPDTATGFRRELERLDRAIAASSDRMERYGLTWLDLGDNLRQVQVDQFTRTLLTDFRALERQIGNTQDTLKAMAPAMSAFIQQSIKAGTKIPVALKPIIERLIRIGGLTEDAARAMLGLEEDTMPALEDITAAAERYGLTLDQLGPKVQQLRINETASQLVKDFNLLSLAGADVGVVMVAMKDKVQGLVTTALKLGLSLPESMRPLLQAMIAAGLLTDEFGVKLTDVGQLTFAESLSTKIDALIDRLGELIDAMSEVGTAAEEGFGRARGAAEALGRAVPRNLLAGTEPGATATPRPGSEAALAETAVSSANALAPSVNDVARGRVLQFPPIAATSLVPTLASESFASPSTAGAVVTAGTVIIELEGQTLVRALVPLLPDEVQRYGAS